MIERIVEKLEEANLAYRNGNPIMSDAEYDNGVETLRGYDPTNDFFNKIGIEVIDESRKVKLPIDMASMNKLKTVQEIKDWIRLKGIPANVEYVLTPKLDGLSLCVDEFENKATTRGDGEYGQSSNEHYKLIENHLYADVNEYGDPFSPINFDYTYGEVIMPKKVFDEKYSKWEGTGSFSNPRNLVAGLLNSGDISESLRDCQYIKYGAIPNKNFKFTTKSEILAELNVHQRVAIEFHVTKDLTEELLVSLFKAWSTEYEIDGIIIEVNDINLQAKLGRETSTNNPCYARAFKHESFEESAIVKYTGISWNISKQGLLKPIIHIEPTFINGVIVSNVTGNNARFVRDNSIGEGAVLKIVRSGMVIPKIIEVVEKGTFVEPTIEGVEIGWNEAGIELITLTETDDQKIKKNAAFFEILEAENFGEGVIIQLWNAGYKTLKEILNLTINDLESIDGFGKRKAKIVFDSIKKSVTNVELSKLQHASGLFIGLGSKKLTLLEDFKTKPSLEQVMAIDGFAEISAKSYLENYDNFITFADELPVTISKKVETVKVSNDLDNTSFVFTGVRDKNAEENIVSRGGKIGGSVSKTTTHLVVKAKGSGSSKEVKALSLGVTILTLEELNDLLSNK
jgi:DNA ligase (NAD+)